MELVENFVDASVLSYDVISPEYKEGVPIVKVKGSLKCNIAFWKHRVSMGIRSLLFTLHPQRALAIIDLPPFRIVNLWSKLFLIFL